MCVSILTSYLPFLSLSQYLSHTLSHTQHPEEEEDGEEEEEWVLPVVAVVTVPIALVICGIVRIWKWLQTWETRLATLTLGINEPPGTMRATTRG